MREMSVSVSTDVLGGDDEAIAQRHTVALLISGSAAKDVEIAARRIHMRQFGQAAPFVIVSAGTFPCHPGRLQRHLADSIGAANGGSIFVSDLEKMPIRAQDAFVKVLAQRFPPSVRLISGTTVSLRERVAAGSFAEALFYRLNVIHLVIDPSVILAKPTGRDVGSASQ